ncbi:MAG: four helix bundle protein [Candidatus Levybacteria bacterium]|nr:four helix bundle protein [Candidatus Levybacteria bacterium]
MRKPEEIRPRVFKFALRIINLCRSLSKEEVNKILIRQIIRSATSIGANLEEAAGARTRAEFINSTNIARREARETHYWLKIIYEVNDIKIKRRMEEVLVESNEIVSILTSTMKKLRLNTS